VRGRGSEGKSTGGGEAVRSSEEGAVRSIRQGIGEGAGWRGGRLDGCLSAAPCRGCCPLLSAPPTIATSAAAATSAPDKPPPTSSSLYSS